MNSYPSIYNLGHRAVRDLLTVPHYVEEKIDGSQFSFGVYHALSPIEELARGDAPLELRVRSKGAEMIVDAPEKMFTKAVESVKERQHLLNIGWTYRAEYLRVPKHNTLAYDRTPTGHLILFDVQTEKSEWLPYETKLTEAARIGLECVPLLFENRAPSVEPTTLERFREIIDTTTSVLGGQKIEGIVIKQRGPDYLYGTDKKELLGKFVSEQFKEAHKSEWKKTSPASGDILVQLGKQYCHPGRWLKAVQHLREAGTLTDSPKDIGALLIEVQKDLGKECKEEIMRALWKWANPHVMRAATRGLPEWYKEQLLKQQFDTDPGPEPSDGRTAETIAAIVAGE